MKETRKNQKFLKSLRIEQSSIPRGEQAEGIESDWVRMPRVGKTLFGITRAHLYQLWKSGDVKSVAIRQPGKKFGIRLVSKSSILDFISRLDREQNGVADGGAK